MLVISCNALLVFIVHSFTKPSLPTARKPQEESQPECPTTLIPHKQLQCANFWLPQETNWVPRERNEALKTLDVWPSNVFKHEPSGTCHILTVLSPDDVMTHRSTGENSTDQTPLLCPLRTTEDTRFGSFHMHAVRSYRIMVMRSDSPMWQVKPSKKKLAYSISPQNHCKQGHRQVRRIENLYLYHVQLHQPLLWEELHHWHQWVHHPGSIPSWYDR